MNPQVRFEKKARWRNRMDLERGKDKGERRRRGKEGIREKTQQLRLHQAPKAKQTQAQHK
jgi:hypothetical protein